MYTYNQLLAELQAVTADDDTEFVAEIPNIITRAERRMLRDLDLELFEDIDNSLSTTSGARALVLPTDIVMVSSLWAKSGDDLEVVEERSYDYCLDYAPDETNDTGLPKYYAELITGDGVNSQAYLSPTPDAVYALRIKAVKRPAGLASGNQNTWLGDNMGDVLLQAALVESWQFLKNDARMNEAATLYASLLPGAKREVGKLTRRTYASVGASPQPSSDRGQ